MAFLNFCFSFGLGTSSALFLPLLFVFSGFLEGSKKSTGLEIERSQPLTLSLRREGVALSLTSDACACECPRLWPECVCGEEEACERLDNELN